MPFPWFWLFSTSQRGYWKFDIRRAGKSGDNCGNLLASNKFANLEAPTSVMLFIAPKNQSYPPDKHFVYQNYLSYRLLGRKPVNDKINTRKKLPAQYSANAAPIPKTF